MIEIAKNTENAACNGCREPALWDVRVSGNRHQWTVLRFCGKCMTKLWKGIAVARQKGACSCS